MEAKHTLDKSAAQNTRYIVRAIPAVAFVRGTLFVVYDRWMGCDVFTPTPWSEVAEHEARAANAKATT